MILEYLQNVPGCGPVIFDSSSFFSGDENVIHVDNDFSALKAMLILCLDHDHIHEGLEGGWGITLTKVHDFGLEEAEAHLECCFPLIPLFDVAPSNIKFCVDPCASNLCDQFQNQR